MNITEPIIQAASLGTANSEYAAGNLPETLKVLVDKIKMRAEDTESFLYQAIAATFTYRRAGWKPASAEGLTRPEQAPKEELPYFEQERNQLFSRLCNTRYLLSYAYRRALASRRIIAPEYLPALIRRAYNRTNPSRNEEQRLLSGLMGNRGHWLLPRMGLVDRETTREEPWETATHNERKDRLCQYRLEDPAQALELLRSDWKSEPANRRDELLACLRINLSKTDEPFLQEIIDSDRSATVKETARTLLLCIPDSALVNRYRELLKGHLRYNKLLGWSYDTLEYTSEMKHLGLAEVSPNKGEKDSAFLLRQLAERMPLDFWRELFGCDREQAAMRLARHLPFKNYFNLETPIENFKDSQWAYYTLKKDPNHAQETGLIGLLSPSQREEISWPESIKDFDYIPDSWYGDDSETWGPRFSKSVLTWLLRRRYPYFATDTAERLAQYLAPQLRKDIESLASTTTNTTSSVNEFYEKILEFMDLKREIDTLFNDHK